MDEQKEIRFIDLFGGVGGFSLGLHKTNGFHCVGYYEIDKYAVQTYNKNFGTQHNPTDITKLAAGDVPDHDLICAGFPCQSFSIAGKRRGFEDTRGSLFFEIMRIAKHHRTPYLLLENVKGLLNHEGGKTFRTILESLDGLGYDAEWQVLNSKNFGVPQNRERVFITGHLRGEPWEQVFPITKSNKKVTQPLIRVEGETPSGYSRMTDRVYDNNGVSPAIMAAFDYAVPKIMAVSSSGRDWGRESRVKTDEFNTINTGDGGHGQSTANYIGGKNRIRRLTPTECERLQGFPDNWTEGVSDTQRYKQMGNAVTVNVIEAIGKKWFYG